MNKVTHDVIIIGGGPAGLAAAIYTSREKLNTLLLDKSVCGGLPATADLIENYPGFPEGVNGIELADKFKKQALRFGADIKEFVEVMKIEPKGKIVNVATAEGKYSAYAVIIATGSIPKKIGIPGEEEFAGKGVSYCATCDGPLYKNKDVMVVGGGNAAAEEAIFLSNFANKVILIHRRDEMRAAKILQESLQKNKKISLLLGYVPVSINGKNFIESVTIKNRQTDEEKEIEVSGVFIYAGFLPNSKFVENVVKLDEAGYIVTNEHMETSAPGVYAAGDICSKKVRQISVACGEGTIAAISLRDYIFRTAT